jgi:Dolichol-phosphate mannosyltransferase subunit 3 (DPM3)
MRRFYQILSRSVVAFLLWFGSLTTLLFCDCTRKELENSPYNSYLFWVMQLPLYAIVLFGCYALISIGWHLLTLSKQITQIIYIYRGLRCSIPGAEGADHTGACGSDQEGRQLGQEGGQVSIVFIITSFNPR